MGCLSVPVESMLNMLIIFDSELQMDPKASKASVFQPKLMHHIRLLDAAKDQGLVADIVVLADEDIDFKTLNIDRYLFALHAHNALVSQPLVRSSSRKRQYILYLNAEIWERPRQPPSPHRC